MTILSAREVLKDIFGFDHFRGRQLEIIDKLCAGENALVIMPTGAGKSLCFQLPALLLDGMAIVVSPLISLMQNQVEALTLLGLEAASLNSHNSPDENRIIWQKMREGRLKFLYLSPEKLMAGDILSALERLKINLFAIDEAHCISQWGAAFRPEYESLSLLQGRFPGTPIIALTATADQATREQICQKIFSDNVTSYLGGFDRPNITLNVEIKQGWKQQLMRFLKNRGQNENGIIYCLSRKKTGEVARMLVDEGYNALSYHGGMDHHIREENLNRFMAEPDLIMAATVAFGMGIDKPNIRFVFHTDIPASPEAYYQEIGRAGRDGAPADAHMLYGMDDIRMRRMFIENDAGDEDHKRRSHQRLNALLAYCEAPECRRLSLLNYFGDEVKFDQCGNCDLCHNPGKTTEATILARKFLSAMARTGQSFGMGHLIDILTGKNTARMAKLSHHHLPTFGVGKELGATQWKSLARQLMARGFILSDMEFGSLKITDAGGQLLKDKLTFRYRQDAKSSKARATEKARQVISQLPEEAEALFQLLKNYRREIAGERAVPAYIIFSDKSLIDMAVNKPATLDQFGEIYGVGAAKKKEFGARFISFIREN